MLKEQQSEIYNYNIINNLVITVKDKFNLVLNNNSNNKEIHDYLEIVLNKVKKPTWIPAHLYDKQLDLEKRLNRYQEELDDIKRNIAGIDNYGNGMPHTPQPGNPEREQALRRIELEKDIIPMYQERLANTKKQLGLLENEFDEKLKDKVESFIELAPNPKHQDVLKQFYVYKKTYSQISLDSYIAEATALSYRHRGFLSLMEILKNFTKNYH